jgi:hypothetical protein
MPKEYLKPLILKRLFYISHPTISDLECTINLNNFSKAFFSIIVQDIITMTNFNHENITIQKEKLSITFKSTAALKLLYFVFKDHEDHPLYPLYCKWTNNG